MYIYIYIECRTQAVILLSVHQQQWVVRAKHGLGRENTEAVGMRQGNHATLDGARHTSELWWIQGNRHSRIQQIRFENQRGLLELKLN